MLLRPVTVDDLPVLFAHQRDPQAATMAAFTPRDWDAFVPHWTERVLGDPANIVRAIVEGDVVVGYVSTWTHRPDDPREPPERRLSYWLGREHWGRGLASAAVAELLARHERSRPLVAYVAVTNVASRRVLDKQGFRADGEPHQDGGDVWEQRMVLDRTPLAPGPASL